MESGDYQITMFVFNIPVTMHWKGIWVKIARFKGRREIWRRATMQRKTLVIKEAKHKGVEDVTRRKEAEKELEEARKANMLERSIGDELSAREPNKTKVVVTVETLEMFGGVFFL
ncbi:hypothetical protein GOBAR_AA26119 [Gossypium barbadense]|uniref:Uncharacterized protein n=1 Tax=Gossypium barbadense TaxID=3634 RepID=A0A2P5WTY9_GOSBA|nr:hypothetical protein GOBAR_AA26119 [Gossypium barbadense]